MPKMSTRTTALNKLSPSPQTPSVQSKSLSTDAPSAALNAWFAKFESRLESQKQSIVEQLTLRLRESEERVMERFSELSAEVMNLKSAVKHMEERVKKTELKCANVDKLRSEVYALTEQLNVYENNAISSDVIVSGLPIRKDEDILNDFSKLCQTLQVKLAPVRSAFRLRPNNKSIAPITSIIKLSSAADRSQLLKAVAKFCKDKRRALSLSDVGVSIEGKLFIHECLTRKNRELMRLAMQYKKQKRLTSVFSVRGQVFVRARPQTDAVIVTEKTSIESIAAANM